MRLEQAGAGAWPEQTEVEQGSDRLLQAMVRNELGNAWGGAGPALGRPVQLQGLITGRRPTPAAPSAAAPLSPRPGGCLQGIV